MALASRGGATVARFNVGLFVCERRVGGVRFGRAADACCSVPS